MRTYVAAKSCPARHAARRRAHALLVTALVLLGLVLAAPAACTAQALPAGVGAPTWSDEFDAGALDLTRWSHRATGPRSDGFLTKDAVSVDGGVLTIKTYTEGGKHYSGMISTAASGSSGFEQAYGYFEARLKFADAPGGWSAFWLQSRDVGNPMGDPATAGVEMDVVEHRARCVTPPAPIPQSTCLPDIADRVQQGLIWDGYANRRESIKLSDPLPALAKDSWHTYALRWTPTSLTFYYDGAATWFVTGPISRHAQYIVLSSEVGSAFAGAIPPAGYGSREAATTSMQVDYVRVWALATAARAADPPQTTAPRETAAPVLSGVPAVGRSLTCSPGSWSGAPAPSLRLQWLSDGIALPGPSTLARVVARRDRGHVLTCRVTASSSAGTGSALSKSVLIPNAPQHVRPTLVATISCAGACRAAAMRATAIASVRVPQPGRARPRTFKPPATAAPVGGGSAVRVRLALGHDLRVRIDRALREGKRIVVKLGASVRDGDGNAVTLMRRVPLRL